MSYTFPRRVAYQKVTTGPIALANAGSILAVNMTELARINVPSLPVPVKLTAKCVLQNNGASGTNGDAYVGIAAAGAVGVAVAALGCIDSMGELNIGGSTNEPPGRKLLVSYWLPENSGGDYILGGWRETGSDAVNAIANSLVPLELEAVRG
jgi:hypothetical protein